MKTKLTQNNRKKQHLHVLTKNRIDKSALNSFLLFTFASTNFQTTDSKFCFHDSIEESSSVNVKNFKMRNFDKNRKYNYTQLCTKDETMETSLNQSFDDIFAHIDGKNDTAKNDSSFVCSTDDVKTIDRDVNLISALNQCASIRKFRYKRYD